MQQRSSKSSESEMIDPRLLDESPTNSPDPEDGCISQKDSQPKPRDITDTPDNSFWTQYTRTSNTLGTSVLNPDAFRRSKCPTSTFEPVPINSQDHSYSFVGGEYGMSEFPTPRSGSFPRIAYALPSPDYNIPVSPQRNKINVPVNIINRESDEKIRCASGCSSFSHMKYSSNSDSHSDQPSGNSAFPHSRLCNHERRNSQQINRPLIEIIPPDQILQDEHQHCRDDSLFMTDRNRGGINSSLLKHRNLGGSAICLSQWSRDEYCSANIDPTWMRNPYMRCASTHHIKSSFSDCYSISYESIIPGIRSNTSTSNDGSPVDSLPLRARKRESILNWILQRGSRRRTNPELRRLLSNIAWYSPNERHQFCITQNRRSICSAAEPCRTEGATDELDTAFPSMQWKKMSLQEPIDARPAEPMLESNYLTVPDQRQMREKKTWESQFWLEPKSRAVSVDFGSRSVPRVDVERRPSSSLIGRRKLSFKFSPTHRFNRWYRRLSSTNRSRDRSPEFELKSVTLEDIERNTEFTTLLRGIIDPEIEATIVTQSTVGSRSSVVALGSILPDWTGDARLGEHLWNDTMASRDLCHLPENECSRSGAKKKCSVCRITCHVNCIGSLPVSCRRTYRDVDADQFSDGDSKRILMLHHWVSRRRSEQKCRACTKTFSSKFSFNSKDVVAMQCSWCKVTYHYKPNCFTEDLLREPCTMGPISASIVPPDWIIKMLRRNHKSIQRASSVFFQKTGPSMYSGLSASTSGPEGLYSLDVGEMTRDNGMSFGDDGRNSTTASPTDSQQHGIFDDASAFIIKPNDDEVDPLRQKPLLVFLNPRSGGNQASTLLRRFQWLLNPRQVFDLTQGGPRMGLDLYRHVPNVRILACGGDGTAGWIFSTIEELNITPPPPVAVMPLGTGNDLARTLGWGSSYTAEDLTTFVQSVENGEISHLDRWTVECCLQADADRARMTYEMEDGDGEELTRSRPVASTLPLKVFNNYFSLGSDAATTLEFHESREANPEKFTSRSKNKMYYVGVGVKDIFRRSWRDLSEYITLECDGEDMTARIRELQPHVILFLNTPRYGAGTTPWGSGSPTTGFVEPSINDGMLEVIGLSSATLALIQVGGHGDRICQCRTVRLRTKKTIPMQMDGEPCRLPPANIEIQCSHQTQVIRKQTKQSNPGSRENIHENLGPRSDGTSRVAIFLVPFHQCCEDGDVMDFQSTANTSSHNRFERIEADWEISHVIGDICNMEQVFIVDTLITRPDDVRVSDVKSGFEAIHSNEEEEEVEEEIFDDQRGMEQRIVVTSLKDDPRL